MRSLDEKPADLAAWHFEQALKWHLMWTDTRMRTGPLNWEPRTI